MIDLIFVSDLLWFNLPIIRNMHSQYEEYIKGEPQTWITGSTLSGSPVFALVLCRSIQFLGICLIKVKQ
ncbi:hypothetical protein AB2B38_000155 [Balneola sp. MJW-20]|uniref:hypothetical protein n=1 Tax=Gracilimonas aurantiaca TaxID=3234185 RepID=UPI0034677BE7